MSSEPTSVLTFSDLILEVAYKLGIASYGAAGDTAPAIPTDAHDLTLCKRIVNKAIRMFIHDAPPSGWRWTKPIAQVDLWPFIASDSTLATKVTGVYSGGTLLTTLTLHQPTGGTAAFYPSMEQRVIYLGGNPPPGTPGFSTTANDTLDPAVGTAFAVVAYISATQITVQGDATAIASASPGCSYSFASEGDFTLPANFGGQYIGEISYVANTNRGMILRWIDEASIRARRQNYNIESGTPYEAAVRLFPQPTISRLTSAGGLAQARRRWELMTWRIPSEVLSVIFPYIIHFDTLVNLTDVQPAPFGHDETVKAACLAVAEKEVEDNYGPDWTYYHEKALPNSYRVDALSAPAGLGYFSNPTASAQKWPAIKTFRDQWYQRPTVPVFGS